MFKTLTNVRKEKANEAQVITTPTDGTIKLNSLTASKMNVGVGDYVAVVEDEDPTSPTHGLYLTKGHPGDDKNAQVGSKLASPSGKKDTSGALQFSSGNAYRQLGGNSNTKVIFSVADAITHADMANPLYKLEKVGEEEKTVKKAKGSNS